MDKQKILVICQHNSARSQIVEEILRFGKKRKEFRVIGGHDISETSRAIVTIMRSLVISLFIENDDKKVIDQIIVLLSEGL